MCEWQCLCFIASKMSTREKNSQAGKSHERANVTTAASLFWSETITSLSLYLCFALSASLNHLLSILQAAQVKPHLSVTPPYHSLLFLFKMLIQSRQSRPSDWTITSPFKDVLFLLLTCSLFLLFSLFLMVRLSMKVVIYQTCSGSGLYALVTCIKRPTFVIP